MVPEMSIGQYSLPVILTLVMALIYNFFPAISDRYKAMLTIGVGVVLAVVSMFYSMPEVVTFRMWVNTIIGGIFVGATAVGLYEGQKTVRKRHRE